MACGLPLLLLLVLLLILLLLLLTLLQVIISIINITIISITFDPSTGYAVLRQKLLSSPRFDALKAYLPKGLLLRRSVFSQTPVLRQVPTIERYEEIAGKTTVFNMASK